MAGRVASPSASGCSTKSDTALSTARSGMSAVKVSQPAPRVSRPDDPSSCNGPGLQRPSFTRGAVSASLAARCDNARRSEEALMRITAAVLHDVNKPYSLETVDLDPPKRGEVLIKVGAAGVCRSDLHIQKGEGIIALPAVLGHEGSGTVEAIGEGVTMVKPGDRVILSFVPNCGHCHS